MQSNNFWRNTVGVLIVVNLLFWLWSTERLRALGMGPQLVQEPYRIGNQISPELLMPKLGASAAMPSASMASQAH